ncbi:DNA polymerase-3 subunit beta [Hypnocyclicus thermotrophus]|uniref:DNA polymerase-3 subunit beta n=1 Tax=Hypnocyclicus thermotrophus TaxID=1627895 RepID=A0AA46E0A6_9FUSO|nr:DNA polymerase III subunit beta [Hypnocyclicus thermotrophus]TDT72404.1 DNA polymerase-3 subunit beta [Hypnocyclicus thermotrophus]
MKVKVNRQEFIEILSDLSIIIRDNPVRPIISGTKLIAHENNILEFKGTTLEMSMVAKIPALVEEPGEVVFKVPLVLEYIKLLEEENIDLEYKDGVIFIHRAEFSVFDTDDYPNIRQLNEGIKFNIDILDLLDGFEKVKMSAATSSDNVSINCIRMEYNENNIHFVATDTYRLAYFKLEANIEEEFGISIPLETVQAFLKIFKSYSGEVEFTIQDSYLQIQTDKITIFTRLIDSKFPDYKNILKNIPTDKKMEVNNEEFNNSLKKVLTVAKINMDTKDAAIFSFTGNKMTVIATSGRAKTTQKIDMIKDGGDFRASLNTRYVLDFTTKIKKNIIIYGINSSSMFVFKEVKNDNYYYILMPLALRE